MTPNALRDTETHETSAPIQTATPCPRCAALTAELARLRRYFGVAQGAMGITEEEMRDAETSRESR